jgi:hypothetical protein
VQNARSFPNKLDCIQWCDFFHSSWNLQLYFFFFDVEEGDTQRPVYTRKQSLLLTKPPNCASLCQQNQLMTKWPGLKLYQWCDFFHSSWNLQLYFFFFDVEEGVLGSEFHLLFVDWDIVIKCKKQILFISVNRRDVSYQFLSSFSRLFVQEYETDCCLRNRTDNNVCAGDLCLPRGRPSPCGR